LEKANKNRIDGRDAEVMCEIIHVMEGEEKYGKTDAEIIEYTAYH